MASSRTLTAAVGLAISLVVSLAAWLYFDTLLVFLFLPFVPLLFRGRGGEERESRREHARTCPVCGFRTRDPEVHYCPRDGSKLWEE